ncbi:hypothetical protein TNCV_234651 [Trichonephila clavipes]|uniref:Uncharacterized protein n=1 Tax=Trichonephila clavipes TaxID=2585209 RepID=A0A8X6VPR6_TRICX|nr:hypothetical protein TNCV_234651 [Trichonephila clavipes]
MTLVSASISSYRPGGNFEKKNPLASYSVKLVGSSTSFLNNPEGLELANMGTNVAKVAKLSAKVTKSVAENAANLVSSPRFRHVIIELPLLRKRRHCF